MIDAYSVFFDNTGIKGSGSTGLKEMVRGSTEIVVVGLAMDYCVGWTSLDSVELGYPTTMLADMSRPVNKMKGEEMKRKVREVGGQVTTWNSWKNELDDWQRAKDVAEFFIANTGVGVSQRNTALLFITILALVINK